MTTHQAFERLRLAILVLIISFTISLPRIGETLAQMTGLNPVRVDMPGMVAIGTPSLGGHVSGYYWDANRSEWGYLVRLDANIVIEVYTTTP